MDIGRAMKWFREVQGYSRATVAKHIGVNPQSIWKIETGHSIPKPSTVDKFCKVMGIPLAYLIQKSLTVDDFIWPEKKPRPEEQAQITEKV